MSKAPEREGGDFLLPLGIVDLDSGLYKGRLARQSLLDAGGEVLRAVTDLYRDHLVLMGFFARAQGLHEGVLWAVESDNPYVAFGSLRSYAENAAAMTYLLDKPQTLDQFLSDPDARGVPVGKLINHAGKYFDGLAGIYSTLSQYAHPAPRSLRTSLKVTDGGPFGTMQWASVPAFKSESDRLIACGWVVELSEATCWLLRQLAGPTQLGDAP